jgi:AcrR family transcriptional regulator
MKTDRRVQRRRELRQKALIQLISERGYNAITIQDIAGRANVGCTTFYLHYSSQDELFTSCHQAIVSEFHIGPLHPLSREEPLSLEAPTTHTRKPSADVPPLARRGNPRFVRAKRR